MGLFDKLRGRKEAPQAPKANWEEAFVATGQFYAKEGSPTLGVFTLTETVETVLPRDPSRLRAPNGQAAEVWQLALVSTTKQAMVGMVPYAVAMERLGAYIQDERDGRVLTRGLTLAQLEGLMGE